MKSRTKLISFILILQLIIITAGCLNQLYEQETILPPTTVLSTTGATKIILRTTQTTTTTITAILPEISTSTTTLQTTSSTTTTISTSTTTVTQNPIKKYDLDVVYKTDNNPTPNWLKDSFQGKGTPPWEGSVYLATSTDGLVFSDEKLFIDHAGVPNLLLTSDEILIATFQYFSFTNDDMLDVIAYTTSSDLGETWTPVNKIFFEGKGFEKIGPGAPNPVDPTMVELEDGSLRLYFTFHAPGSLYPQLFSARSDGLNSPFKVEGPQLVTDKMILDPAIILYQGIWHHYTVRHGEKEGVNYINVHSTSPDGKYFELQEDIPFEFQFLGQAIEDEKVLRFYGSGRGVESAKSTDGYKWEKEPGSRVDGADPGIVKLPDGSYLMIFTKLN